MLRRFPRASWFFSIFVTAACLATALGGPGSIDRLGPADNPGIADALRKSLDSAGYRVILADGTPLCNLWFRSALPIRAGVSGSLAGVAYAEISESTLVGLVSFPKAAKDYRGQGVKAGLYTLRYALIPADGNHLGAAPARDFLLMVALASDRDPDSQFSFDELVKLSRDGIAAPHPAPLSLLPTTGTGAFPAIEEQGTHVIVRVRIKTVAGSELPLALVVKGEADQ